MEEIKVISHLDKPLKGRFDGEDFVFLPGKPTLISLAAAKHIFGLGDKDKSDALNRLGLLIPGRDTVEEALAKLDRISFLQGRTVFEDEEQAATETQAKDRGTPPRHGPGGEPGVDPRAAGRRGSSPANP